MTVMLMLGSAGLAWSQDSTATPPPAEKAEPAGGTAFGFKGMIGFGIPSYDNLPEGAESETETSWSLGVFYNWSTSGIISFGLQPELLYVSESGTSLFTALLTGQEVASSTQINSLRLPVLAKLQFFDPLVVQPSIYLGPSFSYILSASNTTNNVDYTLEPENSFQVGVAVGVDVTILSILVADLRYNTKFNSIETIVNGQELNFTMSSIRFGLGLRF